MNLNLLKYINVPIFIISLFIGFAIIYFTEPSTRKIYVYPTPDNVNLLQYKDVADNCFYFEYKEVPCPKEEDISIIPVQS